MTEKLSLEQLKAKNAEETAETEIQPAKDKPVEEYVEEETETEAVEVETESTAGDEQEEEAKTESWMQSGEEATPESNDTGWKPNSTYAAKRKKFKDLRGQLEEKDDELETLRQENAQLKQGKPAEVAQPKPMPTMEGSDYDESKYQAAMQEWMQSAVQEQARNVITSTQTETEQQRQVQAQQQAVETALNSHYEAAGKLVESGKITAQSFQNADRAVRNAVDQIFPGGGDQITDRLFSTLTMVGEGSEKVMYQLGVNPSAMQKLQTLLTNDPSGVAASVYLGQLQSGITSPTNRKSNAPRPAKQVNGDTTAKQSALQKQYEKAADPQTRITVKRQAKSQGIDTSNWS